MCLLWHAHGIDDVRKSWLWQHYEPFPFLEPIKITKYGMPPEEKYRWQYRMDLEPCDDTGKQLTRLGAEMERIIKQHHVSHPLCLHK